MMRRREEEEWGKWVLFEIGGRCVVNIVCSLMWCVESVEELVYF